MAFIEDMVQRYCLTVHSQQSIFSYTKEPKRKYHQMVTFHSQKRLFGKISPSILTIMILTIMICENSSAIAGAFASYVTSPLDMAKLRLQIQRMPKTMSNVASDDMTRYKNYSDVLRKVYQANGIRGLFRGASARVFFHTPSTAITMGLFEECKRLWMRTID